jgi:hypothetical protein
MHAGKTKKAFPSFPSPLQLKLYPPMSPFIPLPANLIKRLGTRQGLTQFASTAMFNIQTLQPRPRPSIFIYIFLIFSAFSHEKTGTR